MRCFPAVIFLFSFRPFPFLRLSALPFDLHESLEHLEHLESSCTPRAAQHLVSDFKHLSFLHFVSSLHSIV